MGKKLWPFEELRNNLWSELSCLRFLRHSSVQVVLTDYCFIISDLTVGISLLYMRAKLQRITSK